MIERKHGDMPGAVAAPRRAKTSTTEKRYGKQSAGHRGSKGRLLTLVARAAAQHALMTWWR